MARRERMGARRNRQPARRPRSKRTRDERQVGEKLRADADADRVGRAARGSGTETAARGWRQRVTPCPACPCPHADPPRARSPRVVASRSPAGRHTISGPAARCVAFPASPASSPPSALLHACCAVSQRRARPGATDPGGQPACTRRCAPLVLYSVASAGSPLRPLSPFGFVRAFLLHFTRGDVDGGGRMMGRRRARRISFDRCRRVNCTATVPARTDPSACYCHCQGRQGHCHVHSTPRQP